MNQATTDSAQALQVDDFTQGGAHTATAATTMPRYYGEALLELARQRPQIVCLGADLSFST